MRKNVILIVTLGLMAIGLQSCQLIVDSIVYRKKYPTEVKLTDGTLLVGRAKLPQAYTKKVAIEAEDGTKQKVKATDIASLTAANELNPEQPHRMMYLPKEQGKCWIALAKAGEHVVFFAGGRNYKVDKHGTMTVSGKAINYYAFRSGEEWPTWLTSTNTGWGNRKRYQAYFADDPELCEAIAEKEIKPLDLERICKEYNPKK